MAFNGKTGQTGVQRCRVRPGERAACLHTAFTPTPGRGASCCSTPGLLLGPPPRALWMPQTGAQASRHLPRPKAMVRKWDDPAAVPSLSCSLVPPHPQSTSAMHTVPRGGRAELCTAHHGTAQHSTTGQSTDGTPRACSPSSGHPAPWHGPARHGRSGQLPPGCPYLAGSSSAGAEQGQAEQEAAAQAPHGRGGRARCPGHGGLTAADTHRASAVGTGEAMGCRGRGGATRALSRDTTGAGRVFAAKLYWEKQVWGRRGGAHPELPPAREPPRCHPHSFCECRRVKMLMPTLRGQRGRRRKGGKCSLGRGKHTLLGPNAHPAPSPPTAFTPCWDPRGGRVRAPHPRSPPP